MNKGCIYYTDSRLDESIARPVRESILKSNLPIASCSLKKPLDFGTNVVVEGERSYPTMVKQIITALETSEAENVFFCENDVLYSQSHFDFTPPEDNIFYYNNNVWRWRMSDNKAICYDRMLPLSCLCVNRKFGLDHYKMRARRIEEMGWDKTRSREPRWARRMGYEPGTKKKRRGGFSDDEFQTWSSEYPNIDIRHSKTFSSPKVTLESFKHQPKNWREIPVEDIKSWNLKELFNL